MLQLHVTKQKSPSAYNMFPANSQKSCSTSASSIVSPSSSSWTAFLLFLSLSSDSSLSLSLFLSLSRSSSLGRFRGSRTRGDVLRGAGLSERWPCVCLCGGGSWVVMDHKSQATQHFLWFKHNVPTLQTVALGMYTVPVAVVWCPCSVRPLRSLLLSSERPAAGPSESPKEASHWWVYSAFHEHLLQKPRIVMFRVTVHIVSKALMYQHCTLDFFPLSVFFYNFAKL